MERQTRKKRIISRNANKKEDIESSQNLRLKFHPIGTNFHPTIVIEPIGISIHFVKQTVTFVRTAIPVFSYPLTKNGMI